VKSNKKTCIQSLIITNEILISVLLYSLSVHTGLCHINTKYNDLSTVGVYYSYLFLKGLDQGTETVIASDPI
jgi:hypothetical protein